MRSVLSLLHYGYDMVVAHFGGYNGIDAYFLIALISNCLLFVLNNNPVSRDLSP